MPKLFYKLTRIVVLLVLFTSILLAFLSLPIWQVKKIYVEGNNMLSKDVILNTAKIPIGENVFFINRKTIVNRLNVLPQIKKTVISFRLPESVIITVEERKPFALVFFKSNYLIVDKDGYILYSSDRNDSFISRTSINVFELPTVLGVKESSIVNDRMIDPKTMKTIEYSFLILKKALKDSKFEFELKDENDVNLIIDGSFKVKIGNLENIDKKFETLLHILDKIKDNKSLEYVDIRTIKYPVVKYRNVR